MPILDDDELQDLADIFEEDGMPDSCIIKRTTTIDIPSGEKEDLVVVGESPCLVGDPASAGTVKQLQVYADRLGNLVSWPLSFPLGTDIRIGDILEVTSRLIPQSQEMKVQIALSPKSFAVSLNFIASEVNS